MISKPRLKKKQQPKNVRRRTGTAGVEGKAGGGAVLRARVREGRASLVRSGCSKGCLKQTEPPGTLGQRKEDAPPSQGRELWAVSKILLRAPAAHLGEGRSGSPWYRRRPVLKVVPTRPPLPATLRTALGPGGSLWSLFFLLLLLFLQARSPVPAPSSKRRAFRASAGHRGAGKGRGERQAGYQPARVYGNCSPLPSASLVSHPSPSRISRTWILVILF